MLGSRVSDPGRVWVVRFPLWLRRGVAGDREAVRRTSAFALYATFVPLAFAVEVGLGALAHHAALLGAATLLLVAQAAAVWFVRPMPLWGWGLLTGLVPAAYVMYGVASPGAGAALAIVLAVPVGWAATFLPGRLAAGAVVMNAAAVASVDFSAGRGAAWILLVTRTLTFAVIALGAHVVVGGLRRAHSVAALRADTDPITGSLSRSRLHDVLHAHLWHADAAAPQGVGLVLIDVDHFKRINDTFGHLAGDDALRRLVDALAPVLRDSDAIGRWGGEEFLVVAPGIAGTTALASLCEKVRTTVQDQPFTIGGQTVRMTVSVGATIAVPGAPVREFLAAADDALYDAKRHGRNRCRIASPRLTAFDVGADAAALGAIRQRVRGAGAAAGLSPEQVDDVALAVSEACSTMVAAGAGSSRSLHVTTHDRTDCFTVTVRDPGPRGPDVVSAADGDLSGAIVEMLAREVRTDRHEDGDLEVSMLFVKAPAAEPAVR